MRAPPRHLAPHKVPRDMHVSHTVSRTSQCMSRTRYGVSTLAFSVHDTRYGTEVWYTGMVHRYGTSGARHGAKAGQVSRGAGPHVPTRLPALPHSSCASTEDPPPPSAVQV